ncbi:MAG: LolA-related protein [Ramlibacter sp.]|nr:LolA-related protein [Ramlibacter sp.]
MTRFLRALALALASATLALAVPAADTITVPQLQRLVQASARPVVAYQEVRESPWLATPQASRGTMHSTPQSLEKRVESPRQETWRMLPDRLEWTGPGGAGKQVMFSQVPALGVLSDVMRRVVAGDFTALEREFRIELHGTEAAWRAQLIPRGAELGRHLESVELQGAGGRLQVIIVAERQGERTTTRLAP